MHMAGDLLIVSWRAKQGVLRWSCMCLVCSLSPCSTEATQSQQRTCISIRGRPTYAQQCLTQEGFLLCHIQTAEKAGLTHTTRTQVLRLPEWLFRVLLIRAICRLAALCLVVLWSLCC
jgi:hypothetical protein